MGSFRCFRDGKCEWTKGLQDFTFQFNEAFGKDYSLSKCLDVSDDKTRKQPEVLLEFPGDKPMVIECKKIVYPPNYYKNHRYFHYFFDDFRASYKEKLKPQLHKDMYQICINENALYESTKRNLPKISEQIVAHILSHLETFTTSNEISSDQPISWCFCRVPLIERDNSYESGLILAGSGRSRLAASNTVEAKEVIARKLLSIYSDTEQKFQGYADYLKILILEICGDNLSIPAPDAIVEIVNNANIPPNIDQIWLADPQDESENLITYHQIF